jgi:hypothetical protein
MIPASRRVCTGELRRLNGEGAAANAAYPSVLLPTLERTSVRTERLIDWPLE